MAQVASEHHPLPMHVLEVVAQRSGGNPQFLRDLLLSAIASGGIGGLPDSAEAAAMARIDALAPDDRALVRRAAVFGLTFHPRMLAWFADDDDERDAERGHLGHDCRSFSRRRATGICGSAVRCCATRPTRDCRTSFGAELHGAVAAQLEAEMDDPEEAAGILSLHYFVAGEYRPAWRYASVAAKRAHGVYAYVEAARLYARALEAGRRLEDVGDKELAAVHEALGDSWDRAGEFRKASEAYTAARRLACGRSAHGGRAAAEALARWRKSSGSIRRRCAGPRGRARPLEGLTGPEAARQAAQSSGLVRDGAAGGGTKQRRDPLGRNARLREAEAVDDADALGSRVLRDGVGVRRPRQGGSGTAV